MNPFIQSFQKNKVGILFILIASISTASGQMFWKLSNGKWNVYLLLGFAFYFIGAALMIVAFRFGSLSVLHPLLSMGYVFALLLGVAFLNEQITMMHIIGTLLITGGAILIGGGDH
ncbi:EamA family transporter [Thermaerobacillus caldiproteolyticus]|uniref:Drug/metabolite transporter (DMT)-like permease n=1 Tax=Thermaerobacillus caldiproteolyticus TaxID=247480 RepID=A0A7V9Z5T9_9BACL|nr:EamA family transporter [Anoxybacillus caldiproteolyticus]MBA2874595.1 drug/metabolite transporter (DMT)-like permease [Anoxybacillus caldiproteolyticus]